MLFYGYLWIFCSKLFLDSQTDTFFCCSLFVVSPILSLKDMIVIPISAFEPEETMFQAQCEVQTCSVLIEGDLDWMQNCEGMMGVSYPALLHLFSMSILPSLLPHVPSCTDMPVPGPT